MQATSTPVDAERQPLRPHHRLQFAQAEPFRMSPTPPSALARATGCLLLAGFGAFTLMTRSSTMLSIPGAESVSVTTVACSIRILQLPTGSTRPPLGASETDTASQFSTAHRTTTASPGDTRQGVDEEVDNPGWRIRRHFDEVECRPCTVGAEHPHSERAAGQFARGRDNGRSGRHNSVATRSSVPNR